MVAGKDEREGGKEAGRASGDGRRGEGVGVQWSFGGEAGWAAGVLRTLMALSYGQSLMNSQVCDEERALMEGGWRGAAPDYW
ncbi:hypothetical protein [Streptomyces zaomyceticus]|uniref:hypothetical protein n=1 Tax=Streptomyces zaomyceticus TaxID=68286 RepID=UPI00341CF221